MSFPFVEKAWKDIVVEGMSDFVLKEKFRLLKERLKWWNKEVFGRVDLEVEKEVRLVNKGDDFLEDDLVGAPKYLVSIRKEATSHF